MFSPAADDAVRWDRGSYRAVTRTGRAADGRLKRSTRMVAEGSLVVSGAPSGRRGDRRRPRRCLTSAVARRVRGRSAHLPAGRRNGGVMTRYRLTVLTPLLAGDGRQLAPIDYMVWKDQVNVLDQRKIFRLLAKSPRLDSYLTQISRADKLDFNSWGGYAQNYALRRIPLESPALSRVFDRAAPDHLFLPTFAIAPSGGIYVPATALKSALRTALLAARMNPAHWAALGEKLESADRTPRSPGEILESAALGARGQSRTRGFLLADSAPRHAGGLTKIYLTRTATLLDRGGRTELGWKLSPRGSVEGRRSADATPVLAEMAIPGTVFEGTFAEPRSSAGPRLCAASTGGNLPDRCAMPRPSTRSPRGSSPPSGAGPRLPDFRPSPAPSTSLNNAAKTWSLRPAAAWSASVGERVTWQKLRSPIRLRPIRPACCDRCP